MPTRQSGALCYGLHALQHNLHSNASTHSKCALAASGHDAEPGWFVQVAINTTIPDVTDFLNHIVASTNMKCLTPPSALSGKAALTYHAQDYQRTSE